MRGPFYIYEQDYTDGEAGETSCVLLKHNATRFLIAPFGDFIAAAQAAEGIEGLADWDALLMSAKTEDEMHDLAFGVIGDRWNGRDIDGVWQGYLWSDMRYDNRHVLLRKPTAEE